MQGEHAHRIWNLIYSQSCFTNITDKCTERRIFHRLISGAPAVCKPCTNGFKICGCAILFLITVQQGQQLVAEAITAAGVPAVVYAWLPHTT